MIWALNGLSKGRRGAWFFRKAERSPAVLPYQGLRRSEGQAALPAGPAAARRIYSRFIMGKETPRVNKEGTIFSQFARYVSLNVLSMAGLSCYILADTYLFPPVWAATASRRCTAALDPATAEKVLDLTKSIVAEKKITCLMVTHNMHQALELATAPS